MEHSTGSVILRIPETTLDVLPVPVPKQSSSKANSKEIVLRRKGDEFRKLVDGLYKDYRLNMEHRRYRTSIILAGAMSEAILYQLLLDQEVRKGLLEKDNSLGFGRLIKYVQLLRLDEEVGVPLNHLMDLQGKRNRAVHTGSAKIDHSDFKRSDLDCFDHIVRHFGI